MLNDNKRNKRSKRNHKIPYIYLIVIGIILVIIFAVTIFVIKNKKSKESADNAGSNTIQERAKNQLIDSDQVYDEKDLPNMTEYETEGISVNYPETWTVDGDALSDEDDVIVKYNSAENDMTVNISKVEIESPISLDDYIANAKDQYPKKDSSLKIISTEKTIVAGVEAAMVIYTNTAKDTETRTIQIFTTVEKTAYIVNVVVLESVYEDKKVEISAFINSLKLEDFEGSLQ